MQLDLNNTFSLTFTLMHTYSNEVFRLDLGNRLLYAVDPHIRRNRIYCLQSFHSFLSV